MMYLHHSKFITPLYFLGLLFGSLCTAAPLAPAKLIGPITYAEIGDQFIKNFDADAWIAPAKTEEAYVVPMSEADKCKYAIEMLSKSEAYKSSFTNELSLTALRNLHHDIELFPVVWPLIKKTRTAFGHAVLAKMLSTPLLNADTLEKKQAFIQLLLEDEALFDELCVVLNKVKEAESALLSYAVEEDGATKELIKSFYFRNIFTEDFNGDARGLEVAARWHVALAVWPLVADVVGRATAKYLFEAQIARTNPTILESLKGGFNDLYNPVAVYQDYLDYKSGVHNNYVEKIYSNVIDPVDGKSVAELAVKGMAYMKLVELAQMPFNMWLKWQAVKETKENITLRMNVLYKLQERLSGFATLLDALTAIDKLMGAQPIIKQGLVTVDALKILRKPATVSQDFATLLETLQTDTFRGKPSFFSFSGRVLLAHRLMKKQKNALAPLCELLGEIDACVSIAQLIKEYKQQRVQYSFVRFVESNKPYLQLRNFWNPMVDHTVVVPNSIQLGAHNNIRSMIVTGSNTGGKSTLLKGMLISALFGQTLGIIPAQEGSMTLFVYLGSSLNIIDNTQDGKSLFQAEVDRASALIHATNLFSGKGNCLLVIDELFRGTGPEQAELKTYECAKSLVGKENTALVLATHYKKFVTNLEQEMAGLCKNYKIEVYLDADGKTLIRPFLLEEGISMNNIASAILDNALDNRLPLVQ